MELGAFSISLAVADLSASTAFYEQLGFESRGGDGETWSIMVSGTTVIGLFQGMFEGNILTFNPGWTGPGEEAASFTDIRELQRQVEAVGLQKGKSRIEGDAGPGYFTLVDPDGNTVLVDQHR